MEAIISKRSKRPDQDLKGLHPKTNDDTSCHYSNYHDDEAIFFFADVCFVDKKKSLCNYTCLSD